MQNVIINENEIITFTNYASGIRLPHCSKLTINLKNDNDVTIFQHDIFVKFFWDCFFFLSSLVTEFVFVRDWPEIRKLSNKWRLERVRNTKYGTKVSNKMLLNSAKCQIAAFTVSKLLMENQQGGEGGNCPPPLSRLGLILLCNPEITLIF